MKDYVVLKVLDKLRPLFEKMGINYTIMRKIIQIKLLMDGRRVPTVFSGSSQKAEKDNSNQFIASLWIYIVMGVILIPFIMMKTNYIFQMSIVFGIVLFFIISSLISDFSSVLLDVKDKSIIGICPVDLKTLRMAKTIHVSIYMFYLTTALVGPALLISIYTQGPIFFALFLISVILIDLFGIVLTSLVYSFVLRFFDGEKLKDMINYVQIILSLVITVGYQLVARLFDVIDVNIQFSPKWWQFFIIPVWFSAPFQILESQEYNITLILFSLMAVMVPLVSILYYVKRMPQFEKNLSKLTNNNHRKIKQKTGKASFIAGFLCNTNEERIFFRFASDIMRQEREFKLKLYPNIGFALIFPVIYMFQLIKDTSIQEIATGKSYLFIYFSGILVPTVIVLMKCSEKYKGAWIYKVLPIIDVESVLKGTLKAFLCRLLFPVFFLESCLFGMIFGVRILPDLLLVFCNMMIYISLCFIMFQKELPFSKPLSAIQNGNVGVNLLLLMLFSVFAGIHYLATGFPYGILINLIISSIVFLITWNVAFYLIPKKLSL